MSDDDKRADTGASDEPPADEAERAAAEALARALDGKPGREQGAGGEIAVAEQIRASAGTAVPLGELRARRLAREALAEAKAHRIAARSDGDRQARRRWQALVAALAVAAIVLLALVLRPWQSGGGGAAGATAELPARLRSRPVGNLVPGPFPEAQTAAERLDLVTADRLVAFREVRLRELARRRR